VTALLIRRPVPLPFKDHWRTNLFSLPLLVIVTVLCGSVALGVSFFDRRGCLQHRISRLWARLLVLLSGAQLKVEGIEKLRTLPTAVFVSNHTSYMDTPVIFSTIPRQFRILAKKELWRIPFIGWYLERSGQISIDTANPNASLVSLGVGVKALRSGMPLFVFPEGGRTPNGQLQSFLPGAAYLAIRAQVPVVPIALIGVYDLLPIHTRHFYPGKVILRVGDPISTIGLTVRQLDSLNERLHEAIAKLLEVE